MDQDIIETKIPARLDRLKWGAFHTLIITALGVTWILDGLQVTLVGSISGALKQCPQLHLSDAEIGLSASFYLGGAVLGALLFGWLTDRFGRKIIFFATLGLYILASCATGFAWNTLSFCIFRFLTGIAIGGEYSAVNSTIQELIPARYRGFTDLAINGTFWLGAALGAGGSLLLLNPGLIDPEKGWRAGFWIGGLLGLIILFLRGFVPESPRWLVIHGRNKEAEKVMGEIEEKFEKAGAAVSDDKELKPLRIIPRTHTTLKEVAKALFIDNRQKTLVGLSLMVAQAFFFNAIFFTYALVLIRFYNIPSGDIGLYILPFALSNFLGPLVLGPLFDSIGRKPMIALTYIVSGVLLVVSGWLFAEGALTALEQTLAWMLIFFFASSAAGSAYLTVSETFPVELRALAIAFFYAIGTAIGGAGAPYLLGALIETGSKGSVFFGYCLGSALMILAGLVQWRWGTAAERKSLESVAQPLSSAPSSAPATAS